MDRAREDRRSLVRRLWPLMVLAAVGCQTVKTPEERIAKSDLPGELRKMNMPEYVVEPPDLITVEVLEALPGRPITGERLVRPDGTITLGFYGDLYVAGLTLSEVKEKILIHLRKFIPDETLGLVELKEGKLVPVDPKDNSRVFVDITAYNSKVYYVLGDVGAPGRLPITGNETVLDALQYAGGITPSAAPQNIRLVRPAPPGACCAQILPVNLASIEQAGDTTTNYQLMPGDRLYVYRDPIVRSTVFLNRLAEPFNTVLNSILTYTFTSRSIQGGGIFGGVGGGTTATPTGPGSSVVSPTSPAR